MEHRHGKIIRSGVGQLTLVEHALCPMNSRASLSRDFEHTSTFSFSDKDRKRRSARVRVFCPLGLSPNDELILWGILALTLADESNGGEFHATRHFMMRQLGLIDPNTRRGGRQYTSFTDAIDRLAAVQYFNDNFYDPIRAEHVKANFQFFSYLMPVDVHSSRAWRIVWDPIFFQFAKAARGSLRFHLDVFRELDAASRRLYLFASKILKRSDVTHPIHVDQLATNVLGYDENLEPFAQNARLRECLRRLIRVGILRRSDTKLYKRSKGKYSVVMAKGALLKKKPVSHAIESPLLGPLYEIGFTPRDAQCVLSKFETRLVREWIDITLARMERFGLSGFSKSPPAYLRYNLNRAAAGTGGPPDWWLGIRKAEEHARAERARKRRSTQVPDQLPQKAMDSLDNVRDDIFHQFLAAGQSKKQATQNAKRFREAASRTHTRQRK